MILTPLELLLISVTASTLPIFMFVLMCSCENTGSAAVAASVFA